MRRRRPNSRTNGVPEKKKVQKTSSVEESKKKRKLHETGERAAHELPSIRAFRLNYKVQAQQSALYKRRNKKSTNQDFVFHFSFFAFLLRASPVTHPFLRVS